MNIFRTVAALAGFCLFSTNIWAVKVYECEDELGNRSFEQQCPPGTTSVKEKNYSTTASRSVSGQSKLAPLVLYFIPDCDVCDQVKEFLKVRNISLTEKNIKDNGVLQQELKSKTGGDLRVPVLLIGEKVISGYDRTSLTSALTAAGYVIDDTDKP